MLIRVRRYRYCTDCSGAALSTFLRFLEMRHAKHKFNGMAAETGPRTGSAKQAAHGRVPRPTRGRRSEPRAECAAQAPRRQAEYIHTRFRHPPPQYTQHRLSDFAPRAACVQLLHTTTRRSVLWHRGRQLEIGPRLGPARVPPMPASHLGMAAPTPRSDKRQHPRLLRSQQR